VEGRLHVNKQRIAHPKLKMFVTSQDDEHDETFERFSKEPINIYFPDGVPP
jgi:hypothetical protein